MHFRYVKTLFAATMAFGCIGGDCLADGSLSFVGQTVVVMGTKNPDVMAVFQQSQSERLVIWLNGTLTVLPASIRYIYADLGSGHDVYTNLIGKNPSAASVFTIIHGGRGDDSLSANKGPNFGIEYLYGDEGNDVLVGDANYTALIQDNDDQSPGEFRIGQLGDVNVIHGFYNDAGNHTIAITADGFGGALVTVDGNPNDFPLFTDSAFLFDLPGINTLTNKTPVPTSVYASPGNTVNGATYHKVVLN